MRTLVNLAIVLTLLVGMSASANVLGRFCHSILGGQSSIVSEQLEFETLSQEAIDRLITVSNWAVALALSCSSIILDT